MPNRQMQAKHERAARERAAYAIDVTQRQMFKDTSAIETVTLSDIVAAYTGRVTVIKSKPAARKVSARTVATCQAMRRASAIARNANR